MRVGPTGALALLLAACSGQDDPRDAPSSADATRLPPPTQSTLPGSQQASGERWDLQSSGEGVALALLGRSGGTVIRLFCSSSDNNLLVNVSSFRAVGSEERLSFGSGGEAIALVADPRGDAARGGVSATGPVPADLPDVLSGPLSASYGAQTSGPHPVPPADLAGAFAAACHPAAAPKQAGSASNTPASACMMQGSERLRGPRLRAVGTEPFWGARIEGRCVTYSHPDDQAGTRVWTRYAGTGDGGSWSGALGGRPFTLSVRAQANCSDGMSDRRYPYAVDLLVGGGKRQGCAERL